MTPTGDENRPSRSPVRVTDDVAGTSGADVSAAWQHIEALVDDARRAGRSPATLRAYRSDLCDFAEFCRWHHRQLLPATPDTIAGYAVWLAQPDDDRRPLKITTIERRLAAISTAHRMAGHPSPTLDPLVRTTLQGLRRTLGTAPTRKRAVSTSELVHVLSGFTDSPRDIRDAAILLLGYAGGMRRSELAALTIGDVSDHPDGLVVTIRRSKTDQEARGRTVAIAYGDHELTCPVLATRAWNCVLSATGTIAATDRLWRNITRHGHIGAALSAASIAQIVQRRLAGTGINIEEWGGHSLRRGHATTAASNGATDRQIMRTGGWKSTRTLDGYIDDGQLFHEPSSAKLAL